MRCGDDAIRAAELQLAVAVLNLATGYRWR